MYGLIAMTLESLSFAEAGGEPEVGLEPMASVFSRNTRMVHGSCGGANFSNTTLHDTRELSG